MLYNLFTMKKYSLVFAFDNINQLSYFKYAILTIPKFNYESFDVSVLISDSVARNPKYIKLKEKIIESKIPLVEEIVKDKIPGMFYWLLAPYLLDYEKVIQLDVDILVSSTTNFMNFIEQTKDKAIFVGHKANLFNAKKAMKIIAKYKNSNDEEIFEKPYINSGVVSVDSSRIKSDEFYSKDEMIELLYKYIDFCEFNGLQKTDQEFMYVNFAQHLGYARHNWNIRFFSKYDLSKHLKDDDAILHYNMRRFKFKKLGMAKISYVKRLERALRRKKWKSFANMNMRYIQYLQPNPIHQVKKIGFYHRRRKAIRKGFQHHSKGVVEYLLNNYEEVLKWGI